MHDSTTRLAYKSIQFRPLIPLICKLLRMEKFLKLLNFKFKKSKVNMKYWDISDGEQYKINMHQMEMKFKSLYKNEDTIIMVNILLAQDYDGCQIFKKKHTSFWPLIIQFLNLPPSYRTKLGVGTFRSF